MKKYIVFGLIVSVALFFGASHILDKQQNNNAHALYASYESVDTLVQNSTLVMTCIVSNKEETIYLNANSKEVKGLSQEVLVKDVLMNNSDTELSKNSTINVAYFNEIKSTNDWMKISDANTMKPGKYLLFLNEINNENGTIYVNNTPNHLYRLKNAAFNTNKSLNKFDNMKSKKLLDISEDDVIKAIENNKE